jgi:hypothetical protein
MGVSTPALEPAHLGQQPTVLYPQHGRLTARGRQLLGERREDRAQLPQPVQKLLALNPSGGDTPTAQQSDGTHRRLGRYGWDGVCCWHCLDPSGWCLDPSAIFAPPATPQHPSSHLERSVLTTEDYRGQHR